VDPHPDALIDRLSSQVSLLSELIAMRVEERMKESGLSISTFELLSAIRAGGSGETQAEVARRLGIRPASLSEAVRSAVEKGLLTQKSEKGDKRVKRLVLARKGERVLEGALGALAAAERDMVRGITSERLAQAREVLQMAARNLTDGKTG
jgi:MarR family transcriptional regulator for hemolysin